MESEFRGEDSEVPVPDDKLPTRNEEDTSPNRMPQSQGKETPLKELPVTVTAATVTMSQPLEPVSRSEKRNQTLEGRVEYPIHVPHYATNVTRAITPEGAPKITPVKELPVTVTPATVTMSQPLEPVSRSEKRNQTLEGRVEYPIHVPHYATNVTRAITPEGAPKITPVKELPVTVTPATVTMSQPLKPVSRSEKRNQTLEGRVEYPIHVPHYGTNVTRAITPEAALKIGREYEKISGNQHKNVWEKEQVDLQCERMRQELARKEKELELFMIEREKIRRLRNTFATSVMLS
ncbi:uncharacterized protein LOC111863611 isoform X2 [Cryptotermes secundus]|uniref:uncharacterized protein LOC111863611 isoform X2 n=1 Tax=Cryptotermes secundus TaxID=105785 RepID=UPI001454DB08|nr:uncharacterized protein LOC111863611 isoform X2 [Cryptotermes secundus]